MVPAPGSTSDANPAYVGHIVSDAVNGPRGDPVLSPKLAHDPSNLMLVCDAHHRVFDREMVDEHPVDVLMAMKRRHEDRIGTVTAIDEDLGSHVIRYAAKIGTNESPVAIGDLKWSMLPERYPIDGGWIDLDLVTLDLPDHEPDYWRRISATCGPASQRRCMVAWREVKSGGSPCSGWRRSRF